MGVTVEVVWGQGSIGDDDRQLDEVENLLELNHSQLSHPTIP